MNKRVSKLVLCVVFSFTAVCAFGQDDQLKLNATSLGFGYLYSSIQTQKLGVNFNFDVSAKLKQNIFSLYLNRGYFIQLNEREEKITEASLTYGRAIDFYPWLRGEAHMGIGYFNHSVNLSFSESRVGIPLRLKLLLRTGKHFSIGINPNLNLNRVGTSFAGNLVFQVEFGKG